MVSVDTAVSAVGVTSALSGTGEVFLEWGVCA